MSNDYRIFQFTPKVAELDIDILNIIQATGYEDTMSFPFTQLLDDLFTEAKKIAVPQCAYIIVPSTINYRQKGKLRIGDVTFQVDRIISSSLKNISKSAIFLGTVGKAFDNWLEDKKKLGDPFTEYLSNLIGSEIAEGIAKWTYEIIVNKVKEMELSYTNRYSPGYCGWSVEEQKKLFEFFPENICGISLTDSALMLPIKSVSGIVGIGEKVEWKDYPCEVCNVPICYKNRRSQLV